MVCLERTVLVSANVLCFVSSNILWNNIKIIMKKYLQIAFTTLILSFYFFPFNLRILPTVNTKTTMAGIGLVLLFFNWPKEEKL